MNDQPVNAQSTLDQLSCFVREFAPIVGIYHRELRDNGVPPVVAKSLCEQLQTTMLAKLGFFPPLPPAQ